MIAAANFLRVIFRVMQLPAMCKNCTAKNITQWSEVSAKHICRSQHVLQVSPQGARKPTVVDHFMPADLSSVKQESDVLKDCKIHFINYGSHSKQDMEALVRKLGGTVSRQIHTIVGHAHMPKPALL